MIPKINLQVTNFSKLVDYVDAYQPANLEEFQTSKIDSCNQLKQFSTEHSLIGITKFTNTGHSKYLAKTYDIDAEGNIIKTPAANLVKGIAERLKVTVSEFADLLKDVDSSTAFGYGMYGDEFDDEVTISLSNHQNLKLSILGRTKANFHFAESAGILMIDYDPSKNSVYMPADKLMEVLSEIHPAIKNCAYIIKNSISASVKAKSSPEINSECGYHIYIVANEALDIPRYSRTLFNKLWLTGYGFIDLTANGSMLTKSLFDLTVYSPERLDFVGKPVIVDSKNLEYIPQEIKFVDGNFLDTTSLVDLTEIEQITLSRMIADAKVAIKAESIDKQKQWVGIKVDEIHHQGLEPSRAKYIVERIVYDDFERLYGEFPLEFTDTNIGIVTVSEVIKNYTLYDGKSLADPIEGKGYGHSTAIFYANEGKKPLINSFAHGGQIYYLHSLNNDSKSTGLIKDGNGKYLATLNNIVNALQDRDFCKLEIRLDEFTEQINIDWGDGKFLKFSDTDYAELRMHLPKLGFHEIGDNMIATAAKVVAVKNKYDSAQDWINSLEWDGISRVEKYFSQYMGASDSAYARAVAKYMFTAVVGRILEPGCQADMAPIFVGQQGVGKSSAISALLENQDTFTEISLDEKDADISRKLRGTLLAELPELRGLRKVDVESIKAFITRRKEKWVPKYAEFASEYQRRSIFVGTTNQDAFLGDSTGNRRFLPITVGEADILAIKRDRLQLWSESAVIYANNNDEICWREAEALAKLELDQYEMKEPWHDLIAEWVIPLSDRDAPFTTANILNNCLSIETKYHDRASEIKVQNVMKTLGYKSIQKKIDKTRKSVWVKK